MSTTDDRYEWEDEHDFAEPQPTHVAAYIVTQSYGGPEEGGWWYDEGTVLAALPIPDMHGKSDSEREVIMRTMVQLLKRYCERWTDRDEKLNIHKTCGFPQNYPTTRPHYE